MRYAAGHNGAFRMAYACGGAVDFDRCGCVVIHAVGCSYDQGDHDRGVIAHMTMTARMQAWYFGTKRIDRIRACRYMSNDGGESGFMCMSPGVCVRVIGMYDD